MITVDPSVEKTDAFRILYRLRGGESMTSQELAEYLYGRGGARATERTQTTFILRTLEQLGLVGRKTRPPTPKHRLAADLWFIEEGGERFLELVDGEPDQVAT